MSKNNAQPQPAAETVTARREVWRSVLPALLVLLAVVNVLVFALALKPVGARTREQRDTLQRLQEERQARGAAVARLREIVSRLDAARIDDAAFYQEKLLSRNEGFSIIMEELDKLARASNVNKGSVGYSLGDVPGRPEVNQVEISTMVDGEYAHIVQFVNALERNRLFLLIDSIGVGAGGGTTPGQPRTVKLSLRLAAFFRL
jgi:Tfp pilus assembly protein PilO